MGVLRAESALLPFIFSRRRRGGGVPSSAALFTGKASPATDPASDAPSLLGDEVRRVRAIPLGDFSLPREAVRCNAGPGLEAEELLALRNSRRRRAASRRA